MPRSNGRYFKNDIELCGRVAKALGWTAKRTKAKPKKQKDKKLYEYEIQTNWGKMLFWFHKKDDADAAINEASPAFHESHEDVMLTWLGRKSVHHDFTFVLKTLTIGGVHWAAVITAGETKKVIKRPVQGFPASRPIAEAVDYVYREILHGH